MIADDDRIRLGALCDEQIRPRITGCDRQRPAQRHKSGVAMRFPRVNRIRWDKPAREADELPALEKMLT